MPHSWILECLQELGVNDKIRRLLEESMKSWRVELTCAGQLLGEVKVKRGIFQGDSLSPLLFVCAMIPLTHILRKTKPGYEFSGSGKRSIIYYTWMIFSCMERKRRNWTL